MLELVSDWPDWIGHLATFFIILGVTQKNVKRIRICMILGSICFIVYGLLISAMPVVIANTLIGIVTAKYLYHDLKNPEHLDT